MFCGNTFKYPIRNVNGANNFIEYVTLYSTQVFFKLLNDDKISKEGIFTFSV